MAKRPNPRRIRANQSYTATELAEVLGVSVGCVRGWIREGLPAMTSQRPFLILGLDAREYLTIRQARHGGALAADELWCLSCKMGRRPFDLMVELVIQPGATARIVGLCEVCGTLCNRMISKADIPGLGERFIVATREGA